MKNHVFSKKSEGIKVVAIGGGTGLSTLLSGLKGFVGFNEEVPVWIKSISAIVAVSDDGGSSGRLRDELQMLPPGDIRSCIVALSEDSHLLSKLFQHRFSGEGELGGHSFGNLFLAALTEITGDFADAVKLSSEILASKGHIYPATTEDVRLVAELKDDTFAYGETNISKVGHKIKRLMLEPAQCPPLPEAIDAIMQADIITVGPGSLYTSLIPPLLVDGVAQAIGNSAATKVFINNLMTQPGETDGLSSKKHLEILREYAPQIDFDYMILNNRPISPQQVTKYSREGAKQIGIHGSISPATVEGADIIYGDLLDEGEKVRHHPEKLAKVVLICAMSPRTEIQASQEDIELHPELVH